MPTPHLVVTRPAPQAQAVVTALREMGFEAQALPLIDIQPATDVALVHDAWRSLSRHEWVFFVSPNAVSQFFAAAPTGVAPTLPFNLQVGALGPGTAQALADLGVPPSRVTQPPLNADQIDSEALWGQLAHQPWGGQRVLIIRGDGGRDWLADQLKRQGAQVEFVQAYRRSLPQWTPPQQALLHQVLSQPANHLWLFSSSQSIQHLLELCPDSTAVWPQSNALATHPRIAERARAAGFGRVLQAPPDLHSLSTCIQSSPW